MHEFLLSFSNIVVGLTVCIAMIALIAYPKVDQALKLLCVYFVVSGSFELLAYLQTIDGKANISLLHYFTFFECLLLLKIFSFLLSELKFQFNFNIILYPILVLIIGSSLFIQDIEEYNSISGSIVSISILILSILYFLLILDKEKKIEFASIKKWMITLIFMYHVTLFSFTVFGNYLITLESENALIVWLVRLSVIFIVKILMASQLIRILRTNQRSEIIEDE